MVFEALGAHGRPSSRAASDGEFRRFPEEFRRFPEDFLYFWRNFEEFPWISKKFRGFSRSGEILSLPASPEPINFIEILWNSTFFNVSPLGPAEDRQEAGRVQDRWIPIIFHRKIVSNSKWDHQSVSNHLEPLQSITKQFFEVVWSRFGASCTIQYGFQVTFHGFRGFGCPWPAELPSCLRRRILKISGRIFKISWGFSWFWKEFQRIFLNF